MASVLETMYKKQIKFSYQYFDRIVIRGHVTVVQVRDGGGSVLTVLVKEDTSVFPFVGEGRQLHYTFRGYIQVRSRCNP